MELNPTFYEFALLMAATGAAAVVAHWLKQPLIIAYIGVGILVGPTGLNWVTIGSEIDLLAKTGIALLLFTVGLKLDITVIRSMGSVSLATGLGQVIFTSLVGYAICRALGIEHLPSLYIAVALTFSSTIIIVKLLSDKREIDSLHGRVAVGFLIVQDLVVVLVMIALTTFASDTETTTWPRELLLLLLKIGAIVVVLALLMRYVFPGLMRRAAHSFELLTILAIAWAISAAAIGEWMGLSKEIGAFLAGISLAATPHRDVLAARLVSLRDFMLLFFFVDLGAQFNLGMIGDQLVPALILSAFVLFGNPLIVTIIMGVMGYRKRTGFLAGLTVAQISEFSLMLVVLGTNLGHIGNNVLGLITLVGIITIALSTYMIMYSHRLYDWLAPALVSFERKNPFRESTLESTDKLTPGVDIIIFGLGRFGNRIAHALTERGYQVLGVDFDPDLIRRMRKSGRAVVYGDAEDPEYANGLPIGSASWLVSAIPQATVNLSLLQSLSRKNFSGRVATTAHTQHDADLLRRAGSDLVLIPFDDGAREAVDKLCRSLKNSSGDEPADQK